MLNIQQLNHLVVNVPAGDEINILKSLSWEEFYLKFKSNPIQLGCLLRRRGLEGKEMADPWIFSSLAS